MKRQNQIIALLLMLSLFCACLTGCARTTDQGEITTQPAEITTAPPETSEPPATTVPPETSEPPATTEPVTTAPPAETNIPGVTAKSAFAYSTALNAYTYLKGDPEADLYPASITKLFTAYVALLYLDPNQTVTVGSIITTVPSDASVAGLYQGDRCTVTELLYGLLLCSGSDAARVLAVEAGRIIANDPSLSESAAAERFVAEMNRQAEILGFVNTHFVNMDGYHHEDHHTCLADIVSISRLVLADPLLKAVVSSSRHSVTLSGREIEWYNTNYLVNTRSYYYIPTAIGLKTGNTSAAGRCLVAAFLNGEEITIIGVFGGAEREDHFINIHTIYNHFFS